MKTQTFLRGTLDLFVKGFNAAPTILSGILFLIGLSAIQIFAQKNPQSSLSAMVQPPASNPTGAPLTITLSDALERAKLNSPQFQAALNEYMAAREDRAQARAVLLPTAGYMNQYLYTQGNGTPSGRFIANNGVHEYLSQLNVHEALTFSQIAEYRRMVATEALAKAKSEIASRGLVVTVVQSYYALVVSERKFATAQKAAEEAQRFLRLSQDLERGGEVAHSDSIKAQLQFNDRKRDLREAQLEIEKDRLNLALLLFPDYNQNFTVVDDLRLPPPMPTLEEVETQAKQNNPEIRAALATLEQADREMGVTRGGYFPSIALDYFYGIDASRFAVKTDNIRNLGYAATATVNIPLWNWGATRSKVKQSEYRRKQAQLELSFAQRKLISHLQAFFHEAETARAELELLRSSADLASESLRLTTLRYKAGEASALEVVDAQNAMTQARNQYDDAEARYRVALANLQTLTGVL